MSKFKNFQVLQTKEHVFFFTSTPKQCSENFTTYECYFSHAFRIKTPRQFIGTFIFLTNTKKMASIWRKCFSKEKNKETSEQHVSFT